MAFSIKYKRLFEVRLLHSFFLKGGDAFYSKPQKDQDAELESSFYSIENEFEFIPTENCLKIMKGQRLRMIPSSVGFSVWVEVKELEENDSSRLIPFIPIAHKTSLAFRIKIKNQQLYSFSNFPLRPSIKGSFYWTNTNATIFPSLSLAPAEFKPERAYEMGAIVQVGDKVFKSIRNARSGDGPDTSSDWIEVTDFTDSLNSNQTILISSSCRYQFVTKSGKKMGASNFIFSDSEGAEVIQFNFNEVDVNNSVALNLKEVPAGKYKMAISGKDKTGEDFKDEKLIYLNNDLFDHNDFGLVEISHLPALNEFRLLEEDGQLRNEADQTTTPVFEIRIPGRETYWKYLFKEIDLQKVTDTAFDTIEPNVVVRKTSLPLSRYYQDLSMDYNGMPVALPNPDNQMITSDTIKNYSEIYLHRLT